ncbi:hypothetical protein FRB95_012546 [Tulasnella sp. JGI-2019a]|nr:hypothetical protein FRB95_012546 [Tulasnella sp. JGI-2019a]
MARAAAPHPNRAAAWLEGLARDGRPSIKEGIHYSRLFNPNDRIVLSEQERLLDAPEVPQEAGPSTPSDDTSLLSPSDILATRQERPPHLTPRTVSKSYQNTVHPGCPTKGSSDLKAIFIFLGEHAQSSSVPGRPERFHKFDQLMTGFVESIFRFAEVLQHMAPEIDTGTAWDAEWKRTQKFPLDDVKRLNSKISGPISDLDLVVVSELAKILHAFGFEKLSQETCGESVERYGLKSSGSSTFGAVACSYAWTAAFAGATLVAAGALAGDTALGVAAAVVGGVSAGTSCYGSVDLIKTQSRSQKNDILELEEKAGNFVESFRKLVHGLRELFRVVRDIGDSNKAPLPSELEQLVRAVGTLKKEQDTLLPILVHWGAGTGRLDRSKAS